jgi:hypothetical protein
VYALHTESQEDAPPELLLASRPNKAKEIQMHVKFSFDSHDSPEVLRLAGAFLTTLSDLDHQPQSQLSPSAEGERILFGRPNPFAQEKAIPTPIAQEEAPSKKKRAAKTAPESLADSGQSPSAPIVGGSDTADTSSAPAVDLPKVRALLSEKSRTGKLTQVQALIAQYGGKTLPDIPADKLAEVYSKGLAL